MTKQKLWLYFMACRSYHRISINHSVLVSSNHLDNPLSNAAALLGLDVEPSHKATRIASSNVLCLHALIKTYAEVISQFCTRPENANEVKRHSNFGLHFSKTGSRICICSKTVFPGRVTRESRYPSCSFAITSPPECGYNTSLDLWQSLPAIRPLIGQTRNV